MKKIKFFNGIGGMCAFAVVALVGSLLFTSCEKEDLNATFTTEPAKAIINVKVVELPTGTEVPGATISANKGEVSGMVVTLKAGADNSITADDVVISATVPEGYQAIQPVTVHVNDVKAGGIATYNTMLVTVKTTTPEEQIIVEKTKEESGEVIKKELTTYTHTHNGVNWLENANDYILITKVDYKLYNEQSAEVQTGSDNTSVDLGAFSKALTYNYTKKAVLDLKVSAWSIYRAWYEIYPTNSTYTVKYKESGKVLGTIVTKALNGTAAQYEEMAHPSHAHAYQHGHGHGASENAGGGIVLPD